MAIISSFLAEVIEVMRKLKIRYEVKYLVAPDGSCFFGVVCQRRA